jgi:hypothetical protein
MNSSLTFKIRGINVIIDATTRIGTIYAEGNLGGRIIAYLEAEGFIASGGFLITLKSPNSFNGLSVRSENDDEKIFNETSEIP